MLPLGLYTMAAYKHADGKKIDGRRVLVDVERGRTVKGWRPRRLGGGLGGTRKGGPDENVRFSGRDEYAQGNAGIEDQSGPAPTARGRGGRSLSREKRRRTRSRSRERKRPPSRERERRRSRSKERERRRSRDKEERVPPEVEEEELAGRKEKKRIRRSRSRERRRSRSRERKRIRRSGSRDRSRRRSREPRIKEESDVSLEPPFGDGGVGVNYNNYDANNGGGYGDGVEDLKEDFTQVHVKQEPPDDGYPAQPPLVRQGDDADGDEQ